MHLLDAEGGASLQESQDILFCLATGPFLFDLEGGMGGRMGGRERRERGERKRWGEGGREGGEKGGGGREGVESDGEGKEGREVEESPIF